MSGALTLIGWLLVLLALVAFVKFFWVIVVLAIAYLLAEPIVWLLRTNEKGNDQ